VASTFRSFWFGDALSPIEHLCLKSFLAHGHRFLLYAYDEVENLPHGCELLDATPIVQHDQLFLYKSSDHAGSPAGFSNLFRYTLLDREGGWWVDTDTLCLKPQISEPAYVFARQDKDFYNPAIMRAPAGSPLIRETLERAKRVVADHAENMEFGAIGPHLFTAVIRDLDLHNAAADTADLYPIPYWDALTTCDPNRRDEVEQLVARSTFVHLWTEMFRYWRVPKTGRPPAGAYLTAMYDRYDVPLPAATAFNWRPVAPPREFQSNVGFTPSPTGRDCSLPMTLTTPGPVSRNQFTRGVNLRPRNSTQSSHQ